MALAINIALTAVMAIPVARAFSTSATMTRPRSYYVRIATIRESGPTSLFSVTQQQTHAHYVLQRPGLKIGSQIAGATPQ